MQMASLQLISFAHAYKDSPLTCNTIGRVEIGFGLLLWLQTKISCFLAAAKCFIPRANLILNLSAVKDQKAFLLCSDISNRFVRCKVTADKNATCRSRMPIADMNPVFER